MKRRVIQQKGSYTLTLPIKWVKDNELEKNDEISVTEEDNRLILEPGEAKKRPKSTQLTVTSSIFRTYRSLIGGLYRGGYDEIKVNFKDPKLIKELQKTVDTLYGFEVFSIDQNSCVFRSIYTEQATELKSHVNKAIHNIKTMQKIIFEDLKSKKQDSKEELLQFRNNVLKQRDIVARTIVRQKLFDNKHFPYQTIAYNLWYIARFYYYLYMSSSPKKVSKQDLDLLEKTNKYFDKSFERINNMRLLEKHEEFIDLFDSITGHMKKKGSVSPVYSYCNTILFLIHACNSSILLLNY
jgi:phosphate uptake regulator